MTKVFFVYGTLKVGGFFARSFDKYRRQVKTAAVTGRLLDLGSYPGAIFGGSEEIKGELHVYDDEAYTAENGESIESSLDRIEGYRGPDRDDNLYNKRSMIVVTEDGERVEAIAYEFNAAVTDAEYPVVESGEWDIRR